MRSVARQTLQKEMASGPAPAHARARIAAHDTASTARARSAAPFQLPRNATPFPLDWPLLRAAHAHLKRSAMDIVVYSKDWFSYCDRAKDLLSRKGLPFTEIDVTSDP